MKLDSEGLQDALGNLKMGGKVELLCISEERFGYATAGYVAKILRVLER
ncbi:hypothetical protein [Aureimonas pseudogalii]|uniref:Uncharacterized protein n=1 Tax=Aureimonas pseudogalii TaxID=1744844 RepID=A0A7W6H7X7_9HYPH|nr:hypothetical protein [Aureimonas pseudogalii]MBB4000284.1 hypothetical protein [Aureimonas pseudogalii]